MAANPVVYWELASHDAAKTAEFLKRVLDWDLTLDASTGIYELPPDEESGPIGGGVFTLRRAKLPFLTLYMRVDDIQARARLIEESGGLIVLAPFEAFPGVWICLFNEPSGVTLGLIQRTRQAG
jgi:uncharacterized protein